MTTQKQDYPGCVSPANAISNVIVNTTKDWTQVRAFCKSTIGHVDIILEPKMDKIAVKEMRVSGEQVDELYISASNLHGFTNILNLLSKSISGLEINTADHRYVQIRLTSEKIRRQVEDFVNCMIEKNKR